MNLHRTFDLIATAITLAAGPASAQIATNALSTAIITNAPSVLENVTPKAWSFSLPVTFNFIPNAHDTVQPTLTADRDWLHLEARYNYEALDTGSVWVGYNFSVGDKLSLDFTPMLGGVFGDLNGIAPGYEFTLSYGKLQLYSEGEYVIDAHNSAGNFFYTWSTLGFAPVDWIQFGLVAQRTRVYQTDLDIQRGFFVGCTWKEMNCTTYLLNPDQSKPTVMVALTMTF